jgi:hypothetical protein
MKALVWRGLRRVRRALPITAAILLAAAPRATAAAACCMSATSFGVGRLTIWEDWAAGLRVGYARSLGQWTTGGTLDHNPAGFGAGVTTLEPWAIVRLHPRLQLQAWVPVLVEDREQDATSQMAGGLGDVGAAARWEVVPIGQYAGLPSLAVTVGGVAPTGKRVEQVEPPLFAGTTGRGAWAASLAVESEYARLPWFVRLDAGTSLSFPFEREDTGRTQRYGPSFQLALSGGRELVPEALVAAVAVAAEWEGAITLDGDAVPDSAARSLSVALSLSWTFDPHWTVVGTLTNTTWPFDAGANRDARTGFMLGFRHGHF